MEDPNTEQRGVESDVPEDRGDVQVDPQVAEGDVPEDRGDVTERKATHEDLEQLNAENQQRLQYLISLAKDSKSDVYDRYREEYPKPGKEVEKPAETEEPEFDSDFVTPVQMRQSEDRIVNRIVGQMEGFQEKEQQGKVENKAREDYEAANGTLSDFLSANRISQQQFDWARQRVMPMNIDVGTKEKPTPGGAARYAYMLMTLLEPLVHTPEGDAAEAERLVRIEADAADRGRQTGLHTQPGGAPGGMGTPSPTQRLADEIQPDTPYQASD
jgi:hypothetical protein